MKAKEEEQLDHVIKWGIKNIVMWKNGYANDVEVGKGHQNSLIAARSMPSIPYNAKVYIPIKSKENARPSSRCIRYNTPGQMQCYADPINSLIQN